MTVYMYTYTYTHSILKTYMYILVHLHIYMCIYKHIFYMCMHTCTYTNQQHASRHMVGLVPLPLPLGPQLSRRCPRTNTTSKCVHGLVTWPKPLNWPVTWLFSCGCFLFFKCAAVVVFVLFACFSWFIVVFVFLCCLYVFLISHLHALSCYVHLRCIVKDLSLLAY